jgi:hypothetical protein
MAAAVTTRPVRTVLGRYVQAELLQGLAIAMDRVIFRNSCSASAEGCGLLIWFAEPNPFEASRAGSVMHRLLGWATAEIQDRNVCFFVGLRLVICLPDLAILFNHKAALVENLKLVCPRWIWGSKWRQIVKDKKHAMEQVVFSRRDH